MTTRCVAAGLAVLALAACEGGQAGLGLSFEERYFTARTALEEGDFRRASAQYRGLLDEYRNETLTVRLRLELAHAELRRGEHAAAAAIAQELSRTQVGALRSLARAVLGTALHERARSRMSAGERGIETRRLLTASADALDAMLRDHPELDEGDAMARRAAIVRADLAALG